MKHKFIECPNCHYDYDVDSGEMYCSLCQHRIPDEWIDECLNDGCYDEFEV